MVIFPKIYSIERFLLISNGILFIEQTFSYKRSFKEYIEEYSINGFKTSANKSDKNHLNVVCKTLAYSFAINVFYNKKEIV